MVFFKKVELCLINDKYGGTQRGLFTHERIHPGELIWYCECGEDDATFTREQMLNIIKQCPKLENFVRSYSYMLDDDCFAMPVTYPEEKNNDECAFFNHSCEPNCGFDASGNGIRAIRLIEPGSELVYHYGFLETEQSLTHGLECKCGSLKCKGKLLYDRYRDDSFIEQYFAFFSPFMKRKAIDMKDRWYSDNCYVKRVELLETANIEEWPKALFSKCDIQRGELVAKFSAGVGEEKHYMRNSTTPNCYVKDNLVFADVDIPAESELTIYYHGVLL